MSKLIIGKPRVEKIANNYRLISTIKYDKNKTYDMWFEVEEKYKDYLCYENADAFIVSLISFIVKHEYDVEVEGFLSSKLYYQLTSYLLPLLCDNFNKKKLTIECEVKDFNFNAKGIGASISCGVDSFYTLLKHTDQKDKTYNITHLTFFNAGSHGEYGGEEARKLYNERLERIKKFCDNENYKLVSVDSNMNELIMMSHEGTNTFRTLGCVLVLQKLFNKYYFASCCDFNGSHIDERDTTFYDILNVQCLSTENTTIYCSGIEVNRQKKIEFISQFPITYKWLDVCIMDSYNCGKCEKCIRTMVALDSIGKLEKYKNVFDVEEYRKNKLKIYVKILKYNRDPMKHEFYDEIIKSLKNNNIKIPFIAYVLSYIPSYQEFKNFVKKILPKKIAMKIKEINHQKKIKKGIYDNGGWEN